MYPIFTEDILMDVPEKRNNYLKVHEKKLLTAIMLFTFFVMSV